MKQINSHVGKLRNF